MLMHQESQRVIRGRAWRVRVHSARAEPIN